MTSTEVVLPGDKVNHVSDQGQDPEVCVLGPGLRRDDQGGVTVTKAGLLRRRKVNNGDKDKEDQAGPAREVFWVDCHAKRYVPAKVFRRPLLIRLLLAHKTSFRART